VRLSPEDQAARTGAALDAEQSPLDRAAAIRMREIQGDRAAAEAAILRLPKGDLLLRYQSRTVDSLFAGTALLVIEKSRRIGLTWGVAAFAALKAAAAPEAGGQNIWYMGYDKDMTLEFIEVCAMWARAFGLVAGDIEEEEVLDAGEKGVKAFSIRFASGFRITALPSVPRALRGKQGIVIIDEAAFHKNVDEVIKAAMALLIWGGQVVVISTHDGASNPFNKLITEIDAGNRAGNTMKITFRDALDAGLYERVAMVAKTKGVDLDPKNEWIDGIYAAYGDDAGEELDCVPKIGSGSLLSIEDIIACEHDDCGDPDLYAGGLLYLGRDVARRRDGAVMKGMELIGDVQWERDHYRERGATFAAQDAYMDWVFANRRLAQAWIDQTGMGEKVVEDAQIRHGTSRVVGMLLTGPNRLDLSLSLQRRFQERRIRIRKDPITRSDLMAIKKMGSEESGTMRIVNDGEVHADEFWAYALASRAADMPAELYQYRGIGARGDRPDRQRNGSHRSDRPDRHRRGSRFGKGAY
jgi:phage FluMu gp28-like protein